jgi:hypothetical protein
VDALQKPSALQGLEVATHGNLRDAQEVAQAGDSDDVPVVQELLDPAVPLGGQERRLLLSHPPFGLP